MSNGSQYDSAKRRVNAAVSSLRAVWGSNTGEQVELFHLKLVEPLTKADATRQAFCCGKQKSRERNKNRRGSKEGKVSLCPCRVPAGAPLIRISKSEAMRYL